MASAASYLMQGPEADIFDSALCKIADDPGCGARPEVVCMDGDADDYEDDVVAAAEILKRDGVVVVRNVYDPFTITAWRATFDRTVAELPAWQGSPRVVDDSKAHGFRHAIQHDEWRTDAWPCAFVSNTDVVQQVIQSAAGCPLVPKSTGILPLKPGCPTFGRWHRDTAPLFHWDTVDLYRRDAENTTKLPDWYFTVFTPLDVCDAASGAIEYVVGSHRADLTAAAKRPRGHLACAPGDAVVMNGKLLHHSAPNSCAAMRRLIYSVWTTPWYAEERF
jgi:ectoine hydroxylase-related dioxygenase (phytanoyl-CoA dioxygenase family)